LALKLCSLVDDHALILLTIALLILHPLLLLRLTSKSSTLLNVTQQARKNRITPTHIAQKVLKAGILVNISLNRHGSVGRGSVIAFGFAVIAVVEDGEEEAFDEFDLLKGGGVDELVFAEAAGLYSELGGE